MEADSCRDCIIGREDGRQWCPVHYDPAADNERAVQQTGVGIEGAEKYPDSFTSEKEEATSE